MSKNSPKIPSDPSLEFLSVKIKERQGREGQKWFLQMVIKGGFNLAVLGDSLPSVSAQKGVWFSPNQSLAWLLMQIH